MSATAFPHLRLTADEAVEDADEHLHVRFTQWARPRRGDDIEATWWERWTVEDGRIRAIDYAGVTRMS